MNTSLIPHACTNKQINLMYTVQKGLNVSIVFFYSALSLQLISFTLWVYSNLNDLN